MIYRIDRAQASNAGIVEKMYGQCRALQRSGWYVDHIIQEGTNILMNQEVSGRVNGVLGRIGINWMFWYRLEEIIADSYDLYWIRYTLMIPSQISFLQKIRRRNPYSKIVLDMPTYPYVQEWSGLKGRIALLLDDYYNNKLLPIVDWMMHSGDEKYIHGIATLHMSNGIDPLMIADLSRSPKGEVLQLIAVGKWQYWHGLDRVIEGLKEYTRYSHNRAIHLHIVGEGPSLNSLKCLAKARKVEDCITFHKSIVAERLYDLMDKCHIGIGTLGLHRKGVNIDSSLKHRLYCARALPFVISTRDGDFAPALPFVHRISSDDTSVDIRMVIAWYQSLEASQIRQSMADYARTDLSWDAKLKPLLDLM